MTAVVNFKKCFLCGYTYIHIILQFKELLDRSFSFSSHQNIEGENCYREILCQSTETETGEESRAETSKQLVTSPRHPNTYNSYNVGPTYVGNMESGNDEGQIGPRNSFGGYFKVGSNL